MTAQNSEWQDVLLEDLAAPVRNALVGGPFGSDLVSSDYVPTGVPVIRGENLSLGRWVSGDFVYVSEVKAQKLAANTAGPLDIVFTQRGANHYRQVAMMPAATPRRFVISQSQMKVTVDRTKADPLFVYYLFRAPEQQGYLQRHAIQTGVPHTNLSILRRTPLRIPSLSEQRAIISVLGALDDQIELNHRTNQILEAIARAIFKSWFVDFDPVRAKMDSRQPFGMDAETATLFPDDLKASAIGAIPDAWNVTALGEVASLTRGVSYRSADLANSSTALVTLKSVGRGGGYRVDGLKPFRGEYKPTQIVHPGEIVVAHTDLTQAADVVGRPALVQPTSEYGTLVASLDLAIVRALDNKTSRPFLFGVLNQPAFRDHALGYTNGTTVLHLSNKAIPSYQFALPPTSIIRRFTQVSEPLLDQISANLSQTETLVKLRDTLLPKLLAGEIRVRGAEPLVSEAV